MEIKFSYNVATRGILIRRIRSGRNLICTDELLPLRLHKK